VSKLDKRSLTVFTLLILVVSAFSAPALGASLTVETDRESYLDGEHIKISGSGNPGDSVSVAVIANSTTVFESTAVVSPEGVYTLTYLLSGAQPGEYVVEARVEGYEAEAAFRILGADCRLARDLLALLSRSREKTRDILGLGEEEPEPVGASYERYLMAEEAAEEASELFEEGRCQEATARATEALRLYGESVKLAREGEVDPEDDVDEDVERILKLKDVLGRAHAYLEKVNRTSREFGENGFNVTGVNSLVDEALRLLQRAEEMRGEGLAEEAEELISEANGHLNRAMELIRELNEINKIERARKFLTETEGRLGLMEDRIINMLGNLGVPGHILEAVGAVFQNARMGIEDVKGLLETGDVEEAIDEFKEVFEETEAGLNLVDEFDGNRRGLLDELRKLEARLGYLAEKVEALRKSGVDVSKFSYKFEHAKVLLEKAVYKLETGYVEVAEELIDEIGDIVDAIEEELEALLRRLRSETAVSTGVKDDGGDPDEEEPETGEAEEPEERDEQVLEMLKHLNYLKEEMAALVERLEEMRDAGYDVLYLVPKMEAAKRMAEAAVDSLEEGEKEPRGGPGRRQD
jgi:tetratricopeptide (TPR) repeat protein